MASVAVAAVVMGQSGAIHPVWLNMSARVHPFRRRYSHMLATAVGIIPVASISESMAYARIAPKGQKRAVDRP